jgi:Icc-related predicted phosphoesterase
MHLLKNIFSNNKNIGEKFELKLLKKYGKCNELKKYGINILFITDTHNCLSNSEEHLKNINSSDFDICITLGDISGNDFEIIKKYIPINKLYGIVGNHDSLDSLEQNGIVNINGKILECKGVKIAAIMGSNRYKNGDYGMITQEECLELEQNMKAADILVSHDKAYIYDRHDNVHDGLKGITDYIYRNHIPLHIHGHLHEQSEEILKNGTKSICLYQITLIEI